MIIDPFKDNKFKKYSLDDVIKHKTNGKIVIRVNDCDKTRVVTNKDRSREHQIIKNYNEIDYFIFNSHFIKNYYFDRFGENKINYSKIKFKVITNGCEQNIFKNQDKVILNKVKIVTHHWSNNINKGYETYLKLYEYCKNREDIEFGFIGKNVPDMFKNVPIIGPYVKEELSDKLNEFHIYITDSKYDSCPNHVLEGLSCGLPILYSNVEGGARELSTMSKYKVGEVFNNFDELIEKIDLIKNNYEEYRENIRNSHEYFNIDKSVNKYINVFLENIVNKKRILKLDYDKNVLKIINREENAYIKFDDEYIKLVDGVNVFACNKRNNIELLNNNEYNVEEFGKNKKLDNNKFNILLCSDEKYYVGLFAVLHSVISNTNYLNKTNFNFIIPIQEKNIFSKLLSEFEMKMNLTMNKTVIYIDRKIIDPIIYQSKCYNGGGHLLNLGNLSRLMIGEFMNYNKLLYLDSDSIVQSDIIEKLLNYNLKYDYYSACANLENKNNKKRIVIKMSSILNTDYNWEKIVGEKISKDDYVFMGAPFLTNCKKWNTVYKNIIKIIKIHNETEGGVYKLFTMSIQNILFYKKTGDINEVLQVIQDCGSMRKSWDKEDLIFKDVIDWSGMYKPWFKNGLYRNLWINHDIMNLSENCGEIVSKKNVVEKFVKEEKEIRLLDNNVLKLGFHVYKTFEKYIQNIVDNSKKMNAKRKILYVCDANYLLRKMSRVRFWAIEELGKCNDIYLDIIGPGFRNFNDKISLQQNIKNLNIKFDYIIWYKPLNENYNLDKNIKMPCKTVLRYNEMWDIEWTMKEIDMSNTDIIICHHYNDYLRYKDIYKNSNKEFYYNGHHANPDVFKDLGEKKEYDILISGVTKEKHYPLKYRLCNLIHKYRKTRLRKYRIYTHKHPGIIMI